MVLTRNWRSEVIRAFDYALEYRAGIVQFLRRLISGKKNSAMSSVTSQSESDMLPPFNVLLHFRDSSQTFLNLSFSRNFTDSIGLMGRSPDNAISIQSVVLRTLMERYASDVASHRASRPRKVQLSRD